MLVYRIEDHEGGGIYRGDNSDRNPVYSAASDRHPLPCDDSALVAGVNNIREEHEMDNSVGFMIESRGYIFGFSTTDQLRSWVYRDKWLWELQQNGFRLTVLDIDDGNVIVGHTQAIFKREDAKQESYFNIAEFFGITEIPLD